MPETGGCFLLARILLIAAFFLLPACAFVQPLPLRDPAVNLAWPEPPDAPRIRFLRDIKGYRDILPEQGKLGKAIALLTGESGARLDLMTPHGIASDDGSLLYIADTSARMVHRYDLTGRDVGYISRAGDESLFSPIGVAVDQQGNVYVTDSVNCRVYKFDRDGEFLRTLAAPVEFQRPAGIAVAPDGRKYVADVLARKLYIFGRDDTYLGEFPRPGVEPVLNSPINVAVDRLGNVYVTDAMDFNIKVYGPDGNLKRTVGQIGDGPGSFARPKGVAVDSDLNIYVVDAAFNNFQIFDQEGRLLYFVGQYGAKPGEFSLPSGIFIDRHDRIFITDSYNRRVQVFQYLKEGVKQ